MWCPLIQQYQTKAHILKILTSKLKHQKLDKYKLTGKNS